MASEYYLLSKDTGEGPYLLGKLTRVGRGEYSFKYMINSDMFPMWFMKIPGMDDLHRTYSTEEVKNKIIHRVTPRKNSVNALDMMEQNGVLEYDEWVLLESQMKLHDIYKTDKYPLSDSHQIFYFYSELPRRVNRYD